jgi:hypothetical protein
MKLNSMVYCKYGLYDFCISIINLLYVAKHCQKDIANALLVTT